MSITPNNILDLYQAMLERFFQLGRYADSDLNHGGINPKKETDIKECIDHWQKQLDECQQTLTQFKEISEKYLGELKK
jgi:hypothetical protein